MSWFDASTFSKYAKTALKHAQKNIDKVLDIKDEGDGSVSPRITNTKEIGSDESHLTPQSSKETESFFDSFLGGGLTSQVSNYIGVESSDVPIPSVDVSSSDNVEATTPKRKGKLRDRKSVQKDNTKHDTTVDQDVQGSPSLPASIECQFVGLDNTSKCSDEEIILNPSLNKSNTPTTAKDNLFDDIDLSDTDTSISCSNISDISDDLSPYEERSHSPLNVTESLDVLVDDIILNTIATEKPRVDAELEITDKIIVHEDSDNIPIKCDEVVGSIINVYETEPQELSSNNEIETAEIVNNDDPKGCNVDIVKTEDLSSDNTHRSDCNTSVSGLLEISVYDNVDASINDALEDAEKFTDKLLNASSIENCGTVDCTDMKFSITNESTEQCIAMIGESSEILEEDNLVANLNEAILEDENCESRPSDNDTESPVLQDGKVDILDPNEEVLSSLSGGYKGNQLENDLELCTNVNEDCIETESLQVSEQHNIELKIKSFSTDCIISTDVISIQNSAINDEASIQNSIISDVVSIQNSTISDAASIQNEVGGTSKGIGSEDSLVHVDAVPKSDNSVSSSLCVVEKHEYDPLELIMNDTESILLTSTVNAVDNIHILQQEIDMQENNIEENNKAHVQFDPVKNYTRQEPILEVNQLNEKIATLDEEMKKLQSVIEARETKIIELCKQNISFQESISVYQNQINQLEQVNQGDDEEMENMRQEFTKRIAECDAKCQAAIKERDYCKTKLVETEASIRQSANEQVSVLTNSLLEKEETIQDLLNEGEELSKKELERNTHIKKLRVKLKDVTTNNTSLTEQVTGFEAEVQKLKEAITEKENNEKKLEGELKKLEGITDSQEDEVSTLKEILDDMEEKYKAMESTLKNTYSEINRLNLENAQKDSKIQEASDTFEQRKVLQEKLKDLEKTSKVGKEELLIQLEDLQLAYSRLEHQLGRREDELKKEIEDLHNRLEHAMYRNQELSQSVSAATRPLLRQIENLQGTYAAQSEGWDCVEKSLNDRLISLQDQLALAVEKERAASELAIEATSKLKAMKAQEGVLRSGKTNLQIALDNESNKCKEIESEWKREKSSYETKLSKLKVVVLELEGEKRVLEEQLTVERIKYENDTLRMSTQLTLQQHQSQQQQSQQQQFGSRHSSRTSSISGDFDTSPQKMSSNDTPLGRYLSHSNSYHEGFEKKGAVTTAASIEHLKSQLRSKEGEVFVLNEQIKELEKTKASLAQELVNLANNVEELECTNADFDKLKEEHASLQSRYNAVLQMYGEKAEEAEELKMDIEDVKNMYRQQIQELCGAAR